MLESVIASPEVVHYICKRFDIKMSKKLGQNFLIKRGIVDEIVHAAELTVGEPVLEVGPGIGTLTQGLAQSGRCNGYRARSSLIGGTRYDIGIL